MSITRINEYQSAEGKAEELFEFLKSLGHYISGSEGCFTCEILRDQEADGHFVVIEKWTDEDAHQRSLNNYPKDKMDSAMPLLGAPPTGHYYQNESRN